MIHVCSPIMNYFSSLLHLRSSACSGQDTFLLGIAYLHIGGPYSPVPSQGHSSEGSHPGSTRSQLCSYVLTCSRLGGAQGGASRKNCWSALGYLEREQLSNLRDCSVHLRILGFPKLSSLRCRSSCVLSVACNQPKPPSDTNQPSDSELGEKAGLEESERSEQVKPRAWRNRS